MVIKFEIPHSMSPSGGDVCFLTKAPANFYRAEMELQRRQDQKKVRHTGVTFRGNRIFRNVHKAQPRKYRGMFEVHSPVKHDKFGKRIRLNK